MGGGTVSIVEQAQEAIRKLAWARKRQTEAIAVADLALAKLKCVPEWQEWEAAKERVREAGLWEGTVTTDVRVLAGAFVDQGGDPKALPGVTFKRVTEFHYDGDEALAWAKVNMPALLVLNALKFEKAAASDLIPGAPIQVVKVTKPYIASDLTFVLDA